MARPRTRSLSVAVCLAVAAATGGCHEILGIGGELSIEDGGSGGATGHPGGGAGGPTGGSGGPAAGQGGTTTVTCEDGGLPALESCATPEDEDCNGSDCAVWMRAVIGDVAGTAVGVDAGGNVVAAALVWGSAAIGGGAVIDAQGPTDALLLKYDPAGNLLWTKVLGAPGAQSIRDIHVEPGGHIAVAGHTYADLDLGGAVGTIGAGSFVARLDPDGNALWARRVAVSLGNVSHVMHDSTGDVIAAGSGADVDYGTGQLTGGEGGNFHVAKLAAWSGEVKWARITKGAKEESVSGVAIAANDAVIVTGTFDGPCLALDGPTDLLNFSPPEIAPFIVRIAPDGNYLEGASVYASSTGPLLAAPRHVAVDGGGTPIVVGGFREQVQFASGTYEGGEEDIAYIVRDPASAQGEWSRVLKNEGGVSLADHVATDSRGRILVAGTYSGALPAGPSALPMYHDTFLLKLGSDGRPLWLKTFHFGEGTIQGVASGSVEDETIVIGSFHGSVDLGVGAVKAPRGMFIGRLGY